MSTLQGSTWRSKIIFTAETDKKTNCEICKLCMVRSGDVKTESQLRQTTKRKTCKLCIVRRGDVKIYPQRRQTKRKKKKKKKTWKLCVVRLGNVKICSQLRRTTRQKLKYVYCAQFVVGNVKYQFCIVRYGGAYIRDGQDMKTNISTLRRS